MQASSIPSSGTIKLTPFVAHDSLPDHSSALKSVSHFLHDRFGPSFASSVVAVGHRVVHGLDISDPVRITPQVQETIERAAELAPLHNPPNLQGILASQSIFPRAFQVAVFDTAFHQSMPPEAYMYALPWHLYENQSLRRYGFHGTSYKYLTRRTALALDKHTSDVNAILCHLGAGSSMCAIQGGRSVDTTMGLTPLEGLMMGSRCGDIDPAIVTWLQAAQGLTYKEVDNLLNKKSGFLGLAGNVDLRSVLEGESRGDKRCALAISVFVRRVRKYLGAYWFHLNGDVDAIVFSGGIGENAVEIRRRVCRGLRWAGVVLDEERNAKAVGVDVATEIQSRGNSKVKVLVIPTDEELSIAEQTLEVIAGDGVL